MAAIKSFRMDGVAAGEVEVSDNIFAVASNDALLHEVIVSLRNARHQGTHKTKTRQEVSGGGIKPFRQKGTGRARQGSIREPQMRGGGTVHGPVPHKYKHNTPIRVKRQALCCALSDRLRDDRLSVLTGFELQGPKTKPFAEMIGRLSPENRKTLLVTVAADENLLLSARNMPRVSIRSAADVNALDVLTATRIVLQEEAVAQLEERLS